jgi:hypothetical protein
MQIHLYLLHLAHIRHKINACPKILKLGVVAHTYPPSSSGDRGRRIVSSRLALAKLVRPYLKIKIQAKGLGWGGGCDSTGTALA